LKKIAKHIQHPVISYFLFWIVFFVFTATTSSWYYSSTQEVLITYSIRIVFQLIVATSIIFIFIPKFLNTDKKGLFFLSATLLLLITYVSCTVVKINYLEPNYPVTYKNYLSKLSDHPFYGRIFQLKQFLWVSNYVVQPTFILLAIRFYRKQQALTKLNEQKKIAELTVLKNQLNPHFLFNTLNNLYALAYKKSEKTMLVIQKLSEILDYTLYGCNDRFVPIAKEIELIENYLTLEKVRYDDRVQISFTHQIETTVTIAPLLLLTFIENAFKHGVSQELAKATISIDLKTEKNQIHFYIKNTKPTTCIKNTKDAIGIKNVKKQLDLIYKSNYELIIEDKDDWFLVALIIMTDEV